MIKFLISIKLSIFRICWQRLLFKFKYVVIIMKMGFKSSFCYSKIILKNVQDFKFVNFWKNYNIRCFTK